MTDVLDLLGPKFLESHEESQIIHSVEVLLKVFNPDKVDSEGEEYLRNWCEAMVQRISTEGKYMNEEHIDQLLTNIEWILKEVKPVQGRYFNPISFLVSSLSKNGSDTIKPRAQRMKMSLLRNPDFLPLAPEI